MVDDGRSVHVCAELAGRGSQLPELSTSMRECEQTAPDMLRNGQRPSSGTHHRMGKGSLALTRWETCRWAAWLGGLASLQAWVRLRAHLREVSSSVRQAGALTGCVPAHHADRLLPLRVAASPARLLARRRLQKPTLDCTTCMPGGRSRSGPHPRPPVQNVRIAAAGTPRCSPGDSLNCWKACSMLSGSPPTGPPSSITSRPAKVHTQPL